MPCVLVGISAGRRQQKRRHRRFEPDDLRRDGCHRKAAACALCRRIGPTLTPALVPRSLSEVRWRCQGSGSTSRGPRSARTPRRRPMRRLVQDLAAELSGRGRMTVEGRLARRRSSRAIVPRAARLEQTPPGRTGGRLGSDLVATLPPRLSRQPLRIHGFNRLVFSRRVQ